MSSGRILSRYKRYIQVVESWPLDPLKSEYRDLGALLRKRIDIEFRNGEQSTIEDPEHCDKMLQSLENITANKYKNMYKTEWNGCFGYGFEDAQQAVSDEMLEDIRENARIGIIRRGVKKVMQYLPNKSEQKKLT